MRTAGLAGVLALAVLAAAGGSAQAALRAPAQEAPAPSASVESLPTFTWRAVKGAAEYQFQLSDDTKFNSIVLGKGRGGGSQRTRNTAATLEKTVPDGNYFWRVRAISRTDRVGNWSKPRAFTKAWKSAPVLEAPADEFAVSWPSSPLMLRWAPVKYATKYLVAIATDPSLAQLVGTPQNKPVELPGVAFALQGTLPAGKYYWAITPIDAGGLRGTRSRVGTFTWTWPTATTTSVVDLNDTPQVFDPQVNWALIPGAARYEVEINPDDDFAAGSRVCCKDPIIGTSLSPVRILPNNRYHWRVRAYDIDGNPGQWNRGPTFVKPYDEVVPTVPNLQLRDFSGTLPIAAATLTPGPVFEWDPVPGAAQYHVQWTSFDGVNCGWTNPSGPVRTAATAWTPISFSEPSVATPPGGVGITSDLRPNGPTLRTGRGGVPFQRERAFPDFGPARFVDNSTYCVRVRALSDDSFRENDNLASQVVSEWTYLGGAENGPAFTYQAPSDDSPALPVAQLPAPAYLAPAPGSVTRTPLLRWNPVDGARRYYVFVARDPNFTTVIDAAYTAMTSYAPNWALEDEETSYYWAVIPSVRADGAGISGSPKNFNPQSFTKLSIPSGPIGPVGGIEVTTQPTFRWTPAEAAQKYRLQVSADPQFGDLLEDVLTSSTAYTSSTPYPADTALYWRVRAEQLQTLRGPTVRVELRWSATGSFRRTLTAPALSDDIPLKGELPPPLTWSIVPGAVSYDVQLEESDGDTNVFNVRSAAGTFTRLSGIGTFKFRVRANFGARAGVVSSAYSVPRPFTRLISPPPNPRVTRKGARIVFGWGPAAAAAHYRVEVSTSESFARVIDSVRTDNTSWAPALTSRLYKGTGPLYWRVASMDEGNNVGSFVGGRVRAGRPMSVRVRGGLRRNASSRITVSVRGAGKALGAASVKVSGAGVRGATKRTNRRGSTFFRLRPTQRGFVTVSVTRDGFGDKSVKVRVR